jgi:oligopeptidase B
VPVSVVWRKDRQPGGALHLYGYGAYGIAIGPGFSTTRLSLLDRGMAYAIAHIRGGDDLGRGWYKAGKLEARTNTFNDFIDVARGLIDHGFTVAGKISASGGSAGGELMGAVINQAPELFGAVVADVPFVDVLATMLDESLPSRRANGPNGATPSRTRPRFT